MMQTKIPMSEVVSAAASHLVDKSVGIEDARWIAKMAVRAEAMGRTTHGLSQIFWLCGQIPESVDPARKPKIESDNGAAVGIDIAGGIGQLGIRMALKLAPSRAAKHGVVSIGISRTSWIGAPGAFLLDLVEQGLLAQMHAQNSNCKDCAPVGGIDSRFSTNPIALGFPTGSDPVLAEFSTATMSLAQANQLIAADERARYPAFIDEHGVETTDPTVMQRGGSMHFMGESQTGHKGYALSLWCEALVAMTGGSCNNPDAPARQSLFITVMDPGCFTGRDRYFKEIKRFMAHLKSSRRRPGVEQIRLPGERSATLLREAERGGLSLDEDKLNRLGL